MQLPRTIYGIGFLAVALCAPGRAQQPSAVGPDWSTLLGDAGVDRIYDLAVSADGRVFVVGSTTSPAFPVTSSAFQTSLKGPSDAIVACFDRSKAGASQLVWATYLGGSGDDAGHQIRVDSAASLVTVVGWTSSSDFPTQNAFQASFGGGAQDAFIARLDGSGAKLVYATYLGGNDDDWGNAIAVDDAGVVTCAGISYATNFPTRNAFQSALAGAANNDIVLARIDPRLNGPAQLVWATYLGGTGLEGEFVTFPNAVLGLLGVDIAVDAGGVVTVASRTTSRDFPTTRGAAQETHAGSPTGSDYDACIARLDPKRAGSGQLLWSTYVGGGGIDGAVRVAVDESGAATIAGYTESGRDSTTLPTFPTTSGAFRTGYQGGAYDWFVARVAANGGKLDWSTFLGGSTDREYLFAMALEPSGSVLLGGYSFSKAASGPFPTTAGSYQPTQNPTGPFDAVISRLSGDGKELRYSTYLGGDGPDVLLAIHPDGSGGVFVAGLSISSDFPTTFGAYQASTGGGSEGFAAHTDLLPIGIEKVGVSTPACKGTVFMGVNQVPSRSLTGFRATNCNAPPQSVGLLVIGDPNRSGLALLGIELFVNPLITLTVPTGDRGYVETPLPIDLVPIGTRIGLQYVWMNTAACGGFPTLSASDALDVRVL